MVEEFTSPDSVPKESVEELLKHLAIADPLRFKTFFQYLRGTFPREVTVGCLRHLGEYGLDTTGQQMILWLISTPYFELLVDPEVLAMNSAVRAVTVLRNADPRFFVNFSRLTGGERPKNSDQLLSRALALLDSMGDYSILLPWIRSLTSSPDKHIRSKAAKSLCKLRPNTAVIQRQLKSEDPRVRANAVEALWHVQSEDAILIFQEAMSDPHHRVVLNAVVGLYYQNPERSFPLLLRIAEHPSVMFRAAAIWALGHIGDHRSIEVLDTLARDSSPMVRRKAEEMLTKLRGPQPAGPTDKSQKQPAQTTTAAGAPLNAPGDYRSQWFGSA